MNALFCEAAFPPARGNCERLCTWFIAKEAREAAIWDGVKVEFTDISLPLTWNCVLTGTEVSDEFQR